MPSEMSPRLSCEALCCHRRNWKESAEASIEQVTAFFDSGKVCEFDGPDFLGRGLLLSVLGFLESADSGKIWVDGQDVTNLAEEELRRFRDRAFGFLFQNPYLLPSFSVAQNVAIPLFRIRRSNAIAARERTIQVLDFCGIADLENQRAGSLVLSAQRRVAFARALVHDPRVLVSLSPHAGDDLFELAFRAAEELKLCVLWAGAEAGVPERPRRLIRIRDGRISADQWL